MDARDICRRLNCSPKTLSEWVDRGCPCQRHSEEYPFVGFDVERVRQWLAENNITDWPKENDRDLDVTIRALLKPLSRKEMTPDEAERIIRNLGPGIWG